MANVTQSAHILVFNKDKILLVKHGIQAGHLTGVYGIPGGRLGKNESYKQAAIRELKEETGISVLENDLRMFPNNSYTADIKRKDGIVKRFTMTVFVCQEFSGTLVKSEETIPEWISINKLNNFNLLPNVNNAVEDGWRFVNS